MSDIDTLTIGEAREAVQRGKEIEKILGRCGLGFLNYVMCKK